MLEALKRRSAAGLAMTAVLALSGAALATHLQVPAVEAGLFSPEQLRSLLAEGVQVAERKAGTFRGSLLVRRFTEDGRWVGCALSHEGKAWSQIGHWSVESDSRGRAKMFAHRHHLTPRYRHHMNPVVIHYDPDTGRLLWRKSPSHDMAAKERAVSGWIEWNEGWFQAKWPRIAVDKCPGLDLGGVAVDEHQTAPTLTGLQRQMPDAPLKGLAEPLPVLRGVQ